MNRYLWLVQIFLSTFYFLKNDQQVYRFINGKNLLLHKDLDCFGDFSPAIAGFVHEAPFHASGESSSAPPPKSRDFHLIQDPVGSLQYDLFGFVPVTSSQRSLESGKKWGIKQSFFTVIVGH